MDASTRFAREREREREREFGTPEVRLLQGDSVAWLTRQPAEQFDALITDPPYCSGAMTTAARTADPVAKYAHNGDARGRPTFGGDAKDQRAFFRWCVLWLAECRRLLKPGAYCLVSIDWRMLPTLTDAVQASDLTWRGIIPWDKGLASRAPHKGYFRHQCEYWVWATNGPCRRRTDAGPFPGCFRVSVRQADKFHLTGKPTELMRELVKVVPPGGSILDPFAGSGTTLVAAALEGRRAVGLEREPEYVRIANDRLQKLTSTAAK